MIIFRRRPIRKSLQTRPQGMKQQKVKLCSSDVWSLTTDSKRWRCANDRCSTLSLFSNFLIAGQSSYGCVVWGLSSSFFESASSSSVSPDELPDSSSSSFLFYMISLFALFWIILLSLMDDCGISKLICVFMEDTLFWFKALCIMLGLILLANGYCSDDVIMSVFLNW